MDFSVFFRYFIAHAVGSEPIFCSPGRISEIRFESVNDEYEETNVKQYTYIQLDGGNNEFWCDHFDFRQPLLMAFATKATIQLKMEACNENKGQFQIFKILDIDRNTVKYII